MNKNKLSLSFKLMAPVFLSCVLIIGLMDFFIYKGSQNLFEQHAEGQAFEYVESFLIATEASGSQANITRVTNSLGTYSDIKELFIIDNNSQKIIASNFNKFNNKRIDRLPPHYHMDEIIAEIQTGGNYYKQLGDNHYLLASRSRILSEDRTYQRSITILVLTSPKSISLFFDSFKKDVFLYSAMIFVFALALFYVLLRVILLVPIKKMIVSLSKGQHSSSPVLCEVHSEDELGILATTYNTMIIERFDKRQALISANKELELLSQSDALTKISNRRNFDHVLQEEWHRSIRNSETLSLIMIDIDNFKEFNDTYGHLAGDDCLKIVAKSLDKNIKRPGDLVSRYGGEEFVIILPHSNGTSWELAEDCRRNIESLTIFNDENNKPVRVTISLGYAKTIALKGQHPDVLIKAADMALYEAKAAGRNQVVVNDMNKSVREIEFEENSNVKPFRKSPP